MTTPPTSQFRALAESAAPNATVDGLREGLWNAGNPQVLPTSRTTYAKGCPDGPFYWPGPPKLQAWSEGILKPIAAPSESLDGWWRCDAQGVARQGYGPSVALEERSFDRHGACGHEMLRDDQGRRLRRRAWHEGKLEIEEQYLEGVPHGLWGRLRGKAWQQIQVEHGRVVFERDEALRLGKLFTKTAVEWGDPQKLEQAVMREIGHLDLCGEALVALVRSGDLDPLLRESVLMKLSDWPGITASDVDAILDDARPYPCTPTLCLLSGWPNSVDRLVARALPTRPLDAWLARARQLRTERRLGLLFALRRFGAELTSEETEEVGLALLDACTPAWDLHRIAVVGPPEDGLTLEMFKGPTRAKILALFGL